MNNFGYVLRQFSLPQAEAVRLGQNWKPTKGADMSAFSALGFSLARCFSVWHGEWAKPVEWLQPAAVQRYANRLDLACDAQRIV